VLPNLDQRLDNHSGLDAAFLHNDPDMVHLGSLFTERSRANANESAEQTGSTRQEDIAWFEQYVHHELLYSMRRDPAFS
jgi:hypothetical protein